MKILTSGIRIALSAIVALMPHTPAVAEDPYVRYSKLTYPSVGYYAIAPVQGYTMSVLDHGGYIPYSQEGNYSSNLQMSDTLVSYFDNVTFQLKVCNQNMLLLDTYGLTGGYTGDFHEGHVLPNGNVILLGIDYRDVDMSKLVPGGNKNARVMGAVIQEQNSRHEVVFEWKSLDHIDITDATADVDLTQIAIDYIHVNSIVLDNDGNYLVSCRHLDEVFKINRATGDIMWRLGSTTSKHNDFTWQNDTKDGFTGFSHQHCLVRMQNGHLLMLDNGNMKPTPYSRAVEYAIDETAKTIKPVWSYVAPNGGFSSAMGSVQELANGNILIGWGTTSNQIVATEVTKAGDVVMEMESLDLSMYLYRIQQTQWNTAGGQQKITTPKTYAFGVPTTPSYIQALVLSVTTPSGMAASFHRYAPKSATFDKTPCIPLPYRWSVFCEKANAYTGKLEIDVRSLDPTIEYPEYLTIYRRAVEGQGAFTRLSTTYNAQTGKLTVPNLETGEYTIGHPACPVPVLATPANKEPGVDVGVHFTWSEAIQKKGYELELYKAGATSTIVWSGHIGGNDTTLPGLKTATTYSWRVRNIHETQPGIWSDMWTFTTRAPMPAATAPRIVTDTVAASYLPTFRWTTVAGQSSYRIQVRSLPERTVVLDTLVRDTALKAPRPLKYAAFHEWTVRVDNGLVVSPFAQPATFVVQPEAPELKLPADGRDGIFPDEVALQWTGPSEFRNYHVKLTLDTFQTIWWEDTVRAFSAAPPVLPYESKVRWSVRTVGPYGGSEWSTRTFTIVGAPLLGAPFASSPRDGQTTQADQTTFAWTSVNAAASYTIEVSTSPTFSSPEFVMQEVKNTTASLSTLHPGVRYYWRVMAVNDKASGFWSTVASFVTAPKAGTGLRPIYPAMGDVDIPVLAEFQFSVSPDFVSYRLEVATDSLFTTLVANTSGETSPLAAALPEQTRLYWHVVGLDASGDADTGATSSFTTGIATSVFEPLVSTGDIRTEYDGSVLRILGREQGARRASLIDISGKTVRTTTAAAGEILEMGIAGEASGMYLLGIHTTEGSIGIPIRLIR